MRLIGLYPAGDDVEEGSGSGCGSGGKKKQRTPRAERRSWVRLSVPQPLCPNRSGMAAAQRLPPDFPCWPWTRPAADRPRRLSQLRASVSSKLELERRQFGVW